MMSCDHAPSRASIIVFRESTMFVGFQELGEGKTALLGQCRRCKSTIAIEIDVARGSVVHGEIDAAPAAPVPSRYHFDDNTETAEQHAERIIR